MSKYSEKVARRKTLAYVEREPEDCFSVFPDAAVRAYFRARAGMYGMTTESYRTFKMEIPPESFSRLENLGTSDFVVSINLLTARMLGELCRTMSKKGNAAITVFSIPFGARRRVRIYKVEELHHDIGLPPTIRLWVSGYKNAARPLRRDWGRGKISVEAYTPHLVKKLWKGTREFGNSDAAVQAGAVGKPGLPAQTQQAGKTCEHSVFCHAYGTDSTPRSDTLLFHSKCLV